LHPGHRLLGATRLDGLRLLNLGFDPPTDGEIVYFEHPTCSLYLEKPDEVARYRLIYEHLRAASLSLDDSRRLIARSANDFT
jgi:hypothetical protein